MGLARLLDACFPTHGNWQGLSLGQVTIGWLSYILSQADHRLNRVEDWTASLLGTLQRCLDPALLAADFNDDRLAQVLRYLAVDEHWASFEQQLNAQTLRVYDLVATTVRLDSTSVSSYAQVNEQGLIQFGHSKDHRPDLPQLKVMLASLDPLAMPLVVQPVAGQRADDQLYVPAIAQVRAGLGRSGLLYIGDCKMAALSTRAYLVAGGDYYLMPLPNRQFAAQQLQQARLEHQQQGGQLQVLHCPRLDGEIVAVADGFELVRQQQVELEGNVVQWQERVLLIRSRQRAQSQMRALTRQLTQRVAAITKLNLRGKGRKRYHTLAELQAAVAAILTQDVLSALLEVSYISSEQGEPQVQVSIDAPALASREDELGWQAYASNQPVRELSLEQGLVAYRCEYIIEHDFSRLKGVSLGLSPLYVKRDDHLSGLVRLMSLALRGLVLVEYLVRQRLAEEQGSLAGLYAGQPQRRTSHPSCEQLLRAFRGVSLVQIRHGPEIEWHLTALSSLQQRILTLLGWSDGLYQRLVLPLPPAENARTLC